MKQKWKKWRKVEGNIILSVCSGTERIMKRISTTSLSE